MIVVLYVGNAKMMLKVLILFCHVDTGGIMICVLDDCLNVPSAGKNIQGPLISTLC